MMMKPNYRNSILNVSATILKHYHAQSNFASIPVLEEELKKNPKHIVLVLLDGMGINIINKFLKPEDFLAKNMKQVITSVFPPTTVAATNTVLSGLPPYSTGYVGWVQYFKNEKTNAIVFTNEDFYDKDRKFDKVLRDTYLKYPTIYERIQRHSPDVKTYELFPAFRADGFESLDKQAERVLEITALDEENFTYVYWTEPDLTQHDFGIDAEETKAKLIDLNRSMTELSKKLNKDTVLIVIADHGLTNVEGIDIFEDKEMISLLRRKPSMEPRATSFFLKRFKRDRFLRLFHERYGKDFQLMTREELIDSRLMGFGYQHELLESFIGDFVAVSVSDKMFNFKEHSRFKGHHAGLTQDEMEVPLIIYRKE